MDPRLATLAASAVLAGCSFSVEQFARRNGFEVSAVETGDFRHVVVRRQMSGGSGRLYVYVEGDGVPWVHGVQPARDPTPVDPLGLRLMAQHAADPGVQVAYLGRPCYFGRADDPACDFPLWTSERYSARVVSSMAAAARELVDAGGYTEVILIGFSGGGTIARLMATQLERVAGLMTINANLHVASWVAAHGYQPLAGSLDPIDSMPLSPRVPHVQAIGTRDTVVPESVTRSYRLRHGDVIVWRYPDYDHVCCWLEAWPAILARFDAYLAGAGGG